MGLIVHKELQGSTTILHLEGVLDISTSNVIMPYLENIESIDTLILEFSKLEFIDSTGIGAIMNAIYLSQEKHFIIKFKGIDDLTHQVFETVGLYQILEAIQGEAQ
jgi:anti-anti-sigma factor